MPNYNGSKYLEKAIRSFLNQDFHDKELIIVDGKSTDKSHNIISDFEKINNNIIWIRKKDKGISNAYNMGLEICKGDIVGYLGSDDLLNEDIFKKIERINKWSNFDAVYFNSYTFYVEQRKCVLRECPKLDINVDNLLKYGTIVGLQNIFFKREIIFNYKLNEGNKTCMDFELYLKLCMDYNPLFVRSNHISTINFFDGNISQDDSGKQLGEMISVAKKYAKLTNFKGVVYGTTKKRNFKQKIRHKMKKWLS
jgi:glycosyltransferase involved in cell wall biosynthesis